MRANWAKLIVLPIVNRWSKLYIWSVKWNFGDDLTECRWFKSEQKAQEFAALLLNPIIEQHTFYGDVHPTCVEDMPPAVAAPWTP